MAQATTVTPLDHLVKVLKLGEPSAYRNHTYINGESMYFPTGRVYGGQVIAQSVIAASKTVGPSRLPHSVHGYFIAAGDIRQDLLFDVENLRDGRSFSARRVNVTQAEGSILTAIASFQETGQEHRGRGGARGRGVGHHEGRAGRRSGRRARQANECAPQIGAFQRLYQRIAPGDAAQGRGIRRVMWEQGFQRLEELWIFRY